MKLQLHKSNKKLTSRYIFFRGGVRYRGDQIKDVTIKVLEKQGDGDCLILCVYSLALSIWTAAHQPAEPMQGRGVCWGPGVSKVRADPMQICWAEMKLMQERASPASQGHRFSVKKQRLLQETQSDRTWKPRAAMTHDGHKRFMGSCLPLPFPHYPSPSLLLHRPL